MSETPEEVAAKLCKRGHGLVTCPDCLPIASALREKDRQIDKLRDEVEDWRATQKSVMSEKCPTDEVHCTCVPMLKKALSMIQEKKEG